MPCQYWIYGCTIVSKTRFYVKENITFIYIYVKVTKALKKSNFAFCTISWKKY